MIWYNQKTNQEGILDMKKSGILFYLLVAIPVLAVVLAAAGDSVMVFDTVTKETQY